MLAPRARLRLRERRLQGIDQHGAGAPRFDHVVDVAALRSGVRVRELLLVVGDQLRALRIGVAGVVELAAEDDVHRAVRPHHGDLRSRPGEVEVGADVLGAHDVICAAVGLTRDHRQLRHRRLGVRVEQLRPVPDDSAPFLRRSGEKARHVDERHERDVECIARPNEPRRLVRRVDVEHPGQ